MPQKYESIFFIMLGRPFIQSTSAALFSTNYSETSLFSCCFPGSKTCPYQSSMVRADLPAAPVTKMKNAYPVI